MNQAQTLIKKFSDLLDSAHRAQRYLDSMTKSKAEGGRWKATENELTPIEIEVLIHYCEHAGPHPRLDREDIKEALKDWIDAGAIIDPADRAPNYPGTLATTLGVSWMRAMCRVRRPLRIYVDGQWAPLEDRLKYNRKELNDD